MSIADKFRLTKIEEFIDNSSVSNVFSKLEMFVGYEKIRFCKNVREKTLFAVSLDFLSFS